MRRVYIFIFALLLLPICFSEPLPDVIVLNYNTKEYAIYWGGDEFVHYKLPEGWTVFDEAECRRFIRLLHANETMCDDEYGYITGYGDVKEDLKDLFDENGYSYNEDFQRGLSCDVGTFCYRIETWQDPAYRGSCAYAIGRCTVLPCFFPLVIILPLLAFVTLK